MAQESAKREKIEQSRSSMITVAAIALFVTIFCIFSSHALFNKLSFQNQVISAKTTARNKLKSDISASSSLTNSYEGFNGSTVNLLGGQATGIDNDNAKIVLDALPSTYDYPALTTSIQNLLSNEGVNIDSISGTDESATIGSTPSGSAPVPMPFSFSIDGPYTNIQNVINNFEKSIIPFQFLTLNFAGSQSDVTLTASVQAFFQPATKFTITTEKVE